LITTIPNLITISRILSVPVLIILLHGEHYDWAFLVFLVSGISDGLDGYIAKRYDMESELGGILDPFADKALIVSSYLMLMLLGDVPFWLFMTVIFRDLLIMVGGFLYAAINGRMKMKPSYLSKLNTFTQLSLVVIILGQRSFGLDFPQFTSFMIYATAITTIVSGLHYAWVWLVKEEVELIDSNRSDQ
jgi:cardiolipin synthase